MNIKLKKESKEFLYMLFYEMCTLFSVSYLFGKSFLLMTSEWFTIKNIFGVFGVVLFGFLAIWVVIDYQNKVNKIFDKEKE